MTLPEAVRRLEQAMISKALVAARGNHSKAAALLGITRRQLSYLLNQKSVLDGAPHDILTTSTDLAATPPVTPDTIIADVPSYRDAGPTVRAPDVPTAFASPRRSRRVDVHCHVRVDDGDV